MPGKYSSTKTTKKEPTEPSDVDPDEDFDFDPLTLDTQNIDYKSVARLGLGMVNDTTINGLIAQGVLQKDMYGNVSWADGWSKDRYITWAKTVGTAWPIMN